ncbi:MAG: SurA N-terminal domain-containing protein [Pyrinomonadaceae bacterium]
MLEIEKFEGAEEPKVHKLRFRSAVVVILVSAAAFLAACGGPSNPGVSGSVDPNETAATVNGKAIKMEDVERAVKQQAQGQESKLSPLELAGARLQVLQGLIEQEVMYQRAEKEGTVPNDEAITVEVNQRKVQSGMSAEEFSRQMAQAGLNEQSYREQVKREMAINELIKKVTGRIETPKDEEIEKFYKGNPEMFVKKRGVRLAAIVVDPANSGEGDTTTNQAEAEQKVKEILGRVQQPASDFTALAREFSEDPSRFQGGDLGYFTEDDLKQSYPQLAQGFMNPEFAVGRITSPVNIGGRYFIFKLQERVEKEENLTLESPGVRPQINELLVNNRKQLLAAAFQTIAMNEAKIENFLAKKVVENPNELSGARPAPAAAASPASNANTAPAANAAASNTASSANGKTTANSNGVANK